MKVSTITYEIFDLQLEKYFQSDYVQWEQNVIHIL